MDYNMIKNQCNRILESAGEIERVQRSLRGERNSLSENWKGEEARMVECSMENLEYELSRLVLELEDIQRDIVLCAKNEETSEIGL
ncbi:MAG: WXG100 family type VII secretion target [Lachnospiraceae bacterium]|nr:WXG100 family type VII secretion target [Lachnospiraceae bacterium]